MTLRRYLAIALAAGSIALGLTSGAFRDGEGFLTARFLLPLAVALAFSLYALRFERWGRAGFWVVLALFGQAVSLQLVRAGNAIGYQHYVPYPDLLTAQAIPFAVFLAMEAALVIAGLRPHAATLGGWLRAIGPARLLLVLLIFVLGSSALSADPLVYAGELLFASLVQAIHLGAVGLAAAALPADARSQIGAWLAGWLPASPGDARRVDRVALALAAFVTIACALLAIFSYERHPHVPDEVIYLYHARYFAKGMLTMPVPPVPDAFNLDLMSLDAAGWYSPVPPGWPAVLAIGAFLGAAWLVNPVLNGINVLFAYALLRRMYDLRTARIATLFLCASPWFLFMGMNFMTHTWTLTCALGAAVAVARLRHDHDDGARGRALAWAVPAGAAIGVLGLIRPLEGLTIAVLLGFWALFAPPARWRVMPALAMAAAAVAVVSITFPYNQALAGDPRVFPLMAYTDSVYGAGTNALGFGANRGLGWPGLDPFPGHGIIDVFVNAALNTFMVNVDLLGWATGSLLPIAVLLVSGNLKRADVLMLVVILAIVGIHGLYWFSGGPDFGARYWYLILVPCMVLAARGVEELAGFASRRGAVDADTRTWFGALVLVMLTLALYVPWRAIDKYHHYRFMRPDVRRLADRHDFGRSLVLIRGGRHPDYASAAIYNPIDLRAAEPVYAWDRSPELRRAVLLAYADRDVWIVEGPTESRGGYRVVQGPVPARALLDEITRIP
jgi:hypothetical protein